MVGGTATSGGNIYVGLGNGGSAAGLGDGIYYASGATGVTIGGNAQIYGNGDSDITLLPVRPIPLLSAAGRATRLNTAR